MRGCFWGCNGCDGELYWSELYNDPPRHCEPCDCHGNWIGPAAGSYLAPYAHPYGIEVQAAPVQEAPILTVPMEPTEEIAL